MNRGSLFLRALAMKARLQCAVPLPPACDSPALREFASSDDSLNGKLQQSAVSASNQTVRRRAVAPDVMSIENDLALRHRLHRSRLVDRANNCASNGEFE